MRMSKIVWKNFRGNFSNFTAFFISVIMSVSMVFLFMYVRSAAAGIEKLGIFFYQKYCGLGETLTKYTGGVMIIAVAVIIYSVKFYVKSRMKDYGMLSLLGIRAKDMRKFLILEYTISSVFSCAAGILLGKVLSIFLGKGMNVLIGQNITDSVSMSEVYQWTMGLCVIMTAAALIIIFARLSESGMSGLLYSSEKKEKRVTSKWSLLGLAGGLGIIVLSILLLIIGINPVFIQFIQLLIFVGLFLVLSLGTGYLFEVYKKSKQYYKKILVWNQFYHYFNKNKNIIFIQTIIGIFLLNFCWLLMANSVMVRPPNCPQDFLCITEGGQHFKTEMEQKYQAEVTSFPFVIVSLPAGEPRFAISAAAYTNIFGKDIELKEDEIASIRTHESFASLIKDEKNNNTGRLHLGRDINGEDHYEATKEDITYQVKWEKEQEYLGFNFAGFVVVSDENFQKAVEKDSFNKNMLLIRVPSDKREESEQYVQKQQKKGILESVFSKKIFWENDRKENILFAATGGVLGLSVLLLSMFTVWLKIFAESIQFKEKYQLLNAMGMKHRESRKTLKKEVGLIIWVPMIITAVVAAAFGVGQLSSALGVSVSLYEMQQNVVELWVLEALILTYLVLEGVFILMVQFWIQKKILSFEKQEVPSWKS